MPAAPFATTPAWLTIAEAAAQLGVNPRTVRRRIADNTLPARRVGPRSIRIPASALWAPGEALGGGR